MARHWDADGSGGHRDNLSPRSQQQLLDGEHLLPILGGGGDDMLWDHTGGGGVGTGVDGCGMEAGIHSASPRAGVSGVGSGSGVLAAAAVAVEVVVGVVERHREIEKVVVTPPQGERGAREAGGASSCASTSLCSRRSLRYISRCVS